MIRVRYNHDDGQYCTIRPTPFVQINMQTLKSKLGTFGVTYTIVLTGTLLADHGMPYATNPATDTPYKDFQDNEMYDGYGGGGYIGPYNSFDNVPTSNRSRPRRQKIVPIGSTKGDRRAASAILSKQRALRGLFAQDGQTLVITDIVDDAASTVHCYPRVVSVDFTEGNYVNKCQYTINLEADFLLRGHPDGDAYTDIETAAFAEKISFNSGEMPAGIELDKLLTTNKTGATIIDGGPVSTLIHPGMTLSGVAFIEDFSEDWSLEAEDSVGESPHNPRKYRISHNLSATGKTVYNNSGIIDRPAWVQAKDFVLRRLANDMASNVSGNYPNVMGQIGSGTIDLVNTYRGFNHVRTEQVNEKGGTFSISENWILSSGSSTENYNVSIQTSTSDPFVGVTIDGNIQGLTELTPSGYGDFLTVSNSGAYAKALDKYNTVSNSGKFGLTSDVYKRVNNMVAVQLNAQPISQSLATNTYAGTITYNLAFNNRPTNIISGVLSEQIQVNDTYPGDVFAVIPVLGRKQGPILQYIGGRTEYKRDVSLNLVMDYTKVPYGDKRNPLLLKKPSLVEPTATQIANLLKELSPQGEQGIRKYFVSPPSESWSPKEGQYSFNVTFTYELDK